MKRLTTDQDDIAMLRGRDHNLQGQQELLATHFAINNQSSSVNESVNLINQITSKDI